MKPIQSGSVEISFCSDGDCSGREVFYCRITQRGTLACVGGNSGNEFRKMKAAEGQLFNGYEP
jgi:hypothetical protein